MENTLTVLQTFTYEKGNQDCTCHEIIEFNQGDHLHILEDPFYVDHAGWYISVRKNDADPFYMSIPFIDEKYEDRSLYTEMDLELAILVHQHQIDQSLVNKNKSEFLYHKKELDLLMMMHPKNMLANME
ncbi:hypothetical protein ACJA3J_16695 [Halobacillus sp. SY10]|uniref:Uncharacterized protein n=2 Tax=Halobacillus TaxID=45667 RepID=A0A1H0HVB0_HALAD|nr:MULTISPECIES: hypothetical protein [Halobacillus]RDY70905.1 hypothetical protein DXT76_10455 [Halobacillus trueperi]SDO23108.1 hypothetical protein SAMN05421677_103295 [Halobacillus aidingensis]